MRIYFDIDPCPASRPRVSRWSTYYPKKYTQFKEDMKALTSEMDSTPSKKLISVDVEFNVKIPKSWTKKKKEEKNGKYCDNGCDIDNYLKPYQKNYWLHQNFPFELKSDLHSKNLQFL